MTGEKRLDLQPPLAFVTVVAIIVCGLGLSGFIGPPWPARITALPVLAAAALSALAGPANAHTKLINAGAAVFGAGLALTGLYFYCRWRESVNIVECLIPTTGALVVAIVLNDGLGRLANTRVAAGLSVIVGIGTLVVSFLVLS